MDNMGAGGGGSNGGAIFGSPEAGGAIMSPSNNEADWTKPEDLNNTSEIYAPSAEAAPELAESQEATNSEKAAEKQSSAMPMSNQAQAPVPVMTNANPDDIAVAEAKADVESVNVRRDSETLPKAYMQAVTKIINRNRKDPHRMVTELDVARWDMMGKAFNRKLGDGLNGRGLE